MATMADANRLIRQYWSCCALRRFRALVELLAFLSLLSVMSIQAAEPAPTVAQINSLQAAVTASTDLSDKVAIKLNSDLEAALSLLATLQALQADVETSQREAANYAVRSAKLQRKIRSLLDMPPIEFDTSASETVQQASALQLELSVAQLRQALLDARQQAF